MTGRRRSGAAAQAIARDAGHVAGAGEFPQSWHEREVREDRGRRGVAEAGRGGWACIELGRSQLERSRPSLPCSLARPRACTRVCVRVIHGIAHCGCGFLLTFPPFSCRGFSCRITYPRILNSRYVYYVAPHARPDTVRSWERAQPDTEKSFAPSMLRALFRHTRPHRPRVAATARTVPAAGIARTPLPVAARRGAARRAAAPPSHRPL